MWFGIADQGCDIVGCEEGICEYLGWGKAVEVLDAVYGL